MSKMKRREFLKMAAVGTCGAAVHNIVSPMGGFLAFADPGIGAAAAGPVIVVLKLDGGCSYNIAPPLSGAYIDRMDPIYPNNPIAISGEQGLHPSLTAFKTVWDQGDLALINLAGYNNENRSHDESSDIWSRAIVNGSAASSSGWFARLACQMGGFLTSLSLSGSSLIISGPCNPGKSIGDLSSFGESGFWGGQYSTKWLRETRDACVATANTPVNEKGLYVQSGMVNIAALLEQVQTETQGSLPVSFPGSSLGNQLRDAAKLINSNLGTRLIYVSKGGFDTHSDESSSLPNLLNDVNNCISAFYNCMQALGLWDKVILITTSEFSRTFSNGSGTDHGHAAPMFVMGGSVNGGIKTPAPTPTQVLTAGDWFGDNMIHVDFRQAFKEAVIKMGQSPDAVFPEPFANTAYTNLGLFS